jgi:hypothetical protein
MAYTRTWDSSYEALPPDTGESASAGAGRIRDFKTDIRERMAKDHYMSIAGTDADHGEHVKVTLRTGSAPTQATDKVIIYGKDVSSKCELFAIDEDGDEVQITNAGRIADGFPPSTPILMYRDTAPTGWTIDDTVDDKSVMVTKGSAASGETGGGAHSTGTWTQPSHTHTGPSHTHTGPSHTHTGPSHTHTGPSHNHQWFVYGNTVDDKSFLTNGSQFDFSVSGTGSGRDYLVIDNSGSAYLGQDAYTSSAGTGATGASGTDSTGAGGTGATGASGTGATGGSATANAWRPAAYCFIMASKN